MKTKGRRQSNRVQDLRDGKAKVDLPSRRRGRIQVIESFSSAAKLRKSAGDFKPSDKKPRLASNSKTDRLKKK